MKQSLFEKLKWRFIFRLARRLPDCKTITPVLGESIDRKLTWRERITIKLHFFTCQACANYLKQIKFLREAMHVQEKIFTNGKDITKARMSNETKERIKKALRSSKDFAI